MQIQERKEGKWTVLTVSGNVDSHTAQKLDAAFKERLARNLAWLELDMSHIQYMSSAGLRVLLATLKELQASSGNLRLRAPQENVKEVLDTTGFSDLFTVISDSTEVVS